MAEPPATSIGKNGATASARTLTTRTAELAAAGVAWVQYHFYSDADLPYRRLPLPWATLVITLSGASSWRRGGNIWSRFPALALRGHSDSLSDGVDQPGAAPEYLTVLIEPWAVASLFGLPPSAICNCVVDLHDVIGAGARALDDDIRRSRSAEHKLVMLSRWLLRRAADRAADWRVMQFSRLARRRAGSGAIEAMARLSGTSPRYFRQLFRDEIGVTPKSWARLERFAASVRHLHPHNWSGDSPQTPDYFDQSHAIHEFRHFAGITPVAYRQLKLAGDRRLFLIPNNLS